MQHRKFLFDHSFDGMGRDPEMPGDEPDPQGEAAAREASAAALAAARAEGLNEGYARGFSDGESSNAAREGAALETIAAAFERLSVSAAEAELARTREAARLAVAIARRMVPVLARSAGFAEVEAVVADCLRRALDEPRLVLRVAEEFFDVASRRVEPLARQAGFAGPVIVLADPQLAAADCRVEWADGGAERNTARLWRDIESALSNTLAAFAGVPAADAA
jgi:flagellar assembly protein FliH